jgi:hypothetical protein
MMRIHFAPCAPTALGLCLLVPLPAFPQSGSIGPSKGEVIVGIAGGAAVLGVVGYLICHETHKHPTITGCLASNADGLSPTNEKDKKLYNLAGNLAALQAGEKVAIKAKKVKDSAGKLSFQVEKLTKDLGACQP